MKELDSLIESYFSEPLEPAGLLQLVEQMIGTGVMQQHVSEQEEGEIQKDIAIEDILGALSIDIKNWGTRNKNSADDAMDRKILQSYVQALGAKSQNPDDILRALEGNFNELSQAPPDQREGRCNLAKVVSSIQLLNTLSRILNQFEPRAAGFINEAFLAALFPGGTIVAAEDSEGIEDFKVQGPTGDIHYSLKTKAAGKEFDGSVIDLIKTVSQSDTNSVIYYIFGKMKGGKGISAIIVHKFVIDEGNLIDIIGEEKFDKAIDLLQQDKNKGGGKFYVPKGKYFKEENHVATLTIDNAKLVQVANEYLKELVEQLIEIQQQFKQVVYNMNMYLSTMSNVKAEGFKREADLFNGAVQANVKGDDTCVPDSE